MCLYFRVMMTSVTSEELIVILEEKLEQKLAPFKSTFDELKKTVEDTKELLTLFRLGEGLVQPPLRQNRDNFYTERAMTFKFSDFS